MKWKAYPKHKGSGVEWLDSIPENWSYSAIKYLGSLVGRIGFRGYSSNDIVDENEGAITLSPSNMCSGCIDLTSCTYLSWNKYNESPEIMVTSGDVLLVKTGSTYGKVAYIDTVEYPQTINPQIMIIKSEKTMSKFLFYHITSKLVQDLLHLLNTGSTIPTMTQEAVGRLKLPIPKAAEQLKIIKFLDRETSRIDTLIEKKERQIEFLKEKRVALISHAVTKGLDPNVRMMDSGVEWLGEIPEHWEIKRLKLIAHIQTGNTPSKNDDENYADEGVLWIKPDNLLEFVPITTTKEYLSETGSLRARIIPAKNPLVCCIGTIGKFGYSECNAATNQQINAVIFNNKVLNRFGIYLISASLQEHIKYSNRNVVSILNSENQAQIIFPLPSIEEQKKITSFLDHETTRIDSLIDKVWKSIGLLKEYRTALISAAVTGNIDVREEAA